MGVNLGSTIGVVLVSVAVVAFTAAAVADTTISQPVAATCWVPVVDAPIIDPFRPPACPWCAGNRGVEFESDAGALVHAPTPATVIFAGAVAGTPWITLDTGTERITIGGVDAMVHVGDRVRRGQMLGVSTTTVHVGVRRGDDYLDPARWLTSSGYRARVVPDDGAPGRPASRRPTC
ncbi:MAG: M23 family metallopeptidase [Actinomycetota bacterium]|nr:M23 family metallopeptidase [Ilumatobacteraceae bacterium]MDA2958720.1 M23 family metallopeptidase [Actinomycetota bacterium]MDA3006664.1 M23 family metallopeptidase [Actinomycetota bacterium]MDA3033650.1 M23 family metallopeptidase [Actinomycetota bacterium]